MEGAALLLQRSALVYNINLGRHRVCVLNSLAEFEITLPARSAAPESPGQFAEPGENLAGAECIKPGLNA